MDANGKQLVMFRVTKLRLRPPNIKSSETGFDDCNSLLYTTDCILVMD
jgi:hypothetical protein